MGGRANEEEEGKGKLFPAKSINYVRSVRTLTHCSAYARQRRRCGVLRTSAGTSCEILAHNRSK